jgi:hypothetical protein
MAEQQRNSYRAKVDSALIPIQANRKVNIQPNPDARIARAKSLQPFANDPFCAQLRLPYLAV